MKKVFARLVPVITAILLSGCSQNDSTPAPSSAPEGTAAETEAPSGESGSASQGNAASYVFRMGHSQAPDHPFHDTCEYFADLVSEKTNGDVQINIFPNGQLGDEATMLESCSMGTLDFLMGNGANTAAIVPELSFLGVCYLFDDVDHITRVADDETIFQLYTDMIDNKHLNIKLLNLMGNGMRHLYTTRPVSSLDDLKGMKIRVMPSAVDTEVWNTLGATATTVAFSEVYSALQTHMVDGAENTFSSYAASKHNEVAPYVTLTEHQWLVTELWASEQTLSQLPEEYVTAIYEAASETAGYSLDYQLQVDEEYRKQLEEDGVTILEIDQTPWKEKITPLHEGIAEDLGCSDILARINELR